ncbi:MAG: M23 family metallopeptidase [Pyrinomonadaceae bacterium]|nr:M23 family metallopeptidase [Pyrinomonadaceae bacterium]
MNEQREYLKPLQRLRMRRSKTIVLVALLAVLTMAVSVVGVERIANKLVLYVRVAQLYAQDPPRKIVMPLQVPKKQIANTWHAPRGVNRLHEGQDIFAPRGTPTYSATRGYIYNIGQNGLGGQTVSVVGAGGRVYYYAHFDSYAPGISEGDYVTPQTVLGYVGTTGNAQGTPPHLHFGVYTSTGAINPLPLLTDRPEKKGKKGKRGKGKG